MILASASPRRRRLLEEAGIQFLVRPADVEEIAEGEPHEVAATNARRKAEAVDGELVLGADTVVALGDELLGKPRDAAEARSMLERLSGTTHRVITGVALRGVRTLVRTVETAVTMRELTRAEIDAYVASGEGLGKAGAYAIQQSADRFVTRLSGPYDNVVGLPVETVRAMLEELRS
ncbi:MAG: Maf family protein [Planctomycetota bacterium]|jgi:septum formation protein